MTDWTKMFGGMQEAVALTTSAADAYLNIARFASRHATEYGDTTCYDIEEIGINSTVFRDAVGWTVDGVRKLAASDGWDVLLLDLGDCPDSFHLRRFGSQDDWNEESLRRQLFSVPVLGNEQFTVAARLTTYRENFQSLICPDRIDVPESSGTISNVYLHWLAIGTLAMIEPFRQKESRMRLLNNRRKFYLLTGFEEIFLYAGTVTEHAHVMERK